MSDTTTSKSRIVVLGGGFAGAYCAQALERKLRADEADILVIDRNNYFIFYPFLVEAGTGSLEPRHTVVPIRSLLKRPNFLMGRATGVDLANKTVHVDVSGCENPRDIPYDHLVIALGSVTSLPPVPGLKEHAFPMKSLADAVGLRDRAIRLFEQAEAETDPERRRRLLHWVVVGGNFTGTEVAGEYDIFLDRLSRSYRGLDPPDCNITLIERGDRVLQMLDPELSDYTARVLRERGVNVLLNESVNAIEADRVQLASGEWLETSTVIWCAGIAPNPLLAELDLPRDERGYLLCEDDMRVRKHENVWAIGDCAVNKDPEGNAYPATAQHAVRQGRQLAANLHRVLHGQPTEPCRITSLGSLAALGCRTGVARVLGVKLSGFPAWFLWRTVYLAKMPGFSRKIRIALDWTMDLFFRSHPVQLGLHRNDRT
jgi:NADH:ubiquinone reductase (H+-translocating)